MASRDRETSQETLHGERNSSPRQDEKPDHNTGDEESNHHGKPKPVGFWHGHLNETRFAVVKEWAFLTLCLCTFILAVLSLFWGVLTHVNENLNSIIVYVVDFEADVPGAIVGPAFTKLAQQIVEENTSPHLGYVVLPPSAFDEDTLNVRTAVYNWDAWAAIVVNANATTLLRQAVETGNSSYDPTGACQFIFQSGRDQDAFYDYIAPEFSLFQAQIEATVGAQWAMEVAQNSSLSRENLLKAPQALNPAIGFSQYDLRPFFPYTTQPATSIGLIYLIIISFFSFSFFMPAHLKFLSTEGHPPLKVWQWLLWRWVSTYAAYFFMSLAYSFVSLAFQIPFSNPSVPETVAAINPNPFGHGTFVVYWMVNFIGMGALGLACENMAMILGLPWTSMWLIFWVISNVSTSFYAIELSPAFYRWGYAWPLHSIVEASRTLIFGTKNRLGLDFGILFAWNAVNTALFPVAAKIFSWKQQRAARKAAAKQK